MPEGGPPLSPTGPMARRSSIRDIVHGTPTPPGHSRGLLLAPDSRFWGHKFICALIAEFLGTLMFTFCGSVAPTGTQGGTTGVGAGTSHENWAPWGNGLSIMILVYATANVSGGHLNPALTIATMITGHITILKGVAYIVAQVLGAICGLLLLIGLVPGTAVQMGDSGPGCFFGGSTLSDSQVVGWEWVMTWLLISVVYAVAIGEPSFGNLGPLAVGVTVLTLVFCGGSYTGCGINPARALAPVIVYGCHGNRVIYYVLGEAAGGIVAGMMSGPLYGVRNPLLNTFMPWSKQHIQKTLATTGNFIKRPMRASRDLEGGPVGRPVRKSCPEVSAMPLSPFSLTGQTLHSPRNSSRELLASYGGHQHSGADVELEEDFVAPSRRQSQHDT